MNNQKIQNNQSRWRLPFGFFAGPALWALQLLAGYGLVTLACLNGSKWPVYLLSGIAALLVLIAAIVAYRSWTARADDSLFVESDQAQTTSIFWAVSGFVVSSLFFLLIFATAVAAFFLSPCPIITMRMP